MLQAYAGFAARILELRLDVDAFAKPILSVRRAPTRREDADMTQGRDAMDMGVAGPAVATFLKEVTRWQLAHPDDGAAACRAHMEGWLVEQRANGRLPVAAPAVKKVKR